MYAAYGFAAPSSTSSMVLQPGDETGSQNADHGLLMLHLTATVEFRANASS